MADPLHAVGRGLRRFRRRPLGMRLRTVGAVAVTVGGLAAYVALAPSAGVAAASPSSHASSDPEATASTSTRGVSAHSINIVFPVVALNSLAGQLGFASDVEYGDQTKAIDLFVNQINQAGGIDGRKINPMIVSFDPTNEGQMRGLCKQWTEGSPPVFAVVDALGAWSGDSELCITQEGRTPFLGQWTTVSQWTQQGSPYLWWLGPDDAAILNTLVLWGLQSGRIVPGEPLGIVAGDRASDQAALHDDLLPDLAHIGVSDPVVETLAAGTSETATTNSEAPLVIQRLREAGVKSVIPLIPENAFYPYLSAEKSQDYNPTLLLSDYEDSIGLALGLIPVPYLAELNGQEGITTETDGGIDDQRPYSQGGYDPGLRACWTVWHKKYPIKQTGELTDHIEEQGPIADWCQGVAVLAQALRNAGPDLNRRTFVEGMAKIHDFPGSLTPILSYSPTKFYGPVEYRVVRIHNNVPPSNQCIVTSLGVPQGTCWTVVQNWRPLVP
jgi:hypothetical protein